MGMTPLILSVLNVIHQRDRVSLSLKGDLQIYLSNIRYIFFN